MITSIEFENFKVLRKATLPLSQFTLIVGPNGCGKSTALQALKLIGGSQPLEYASCVSAAERSKDSVIGLTITLQVDHERLSVRREWRPQGLTLSELNGSRAPAVLYKQQIVALLSSNTPEIYNLEAGPIAAPVTLQPRMRLGSDGSGLAGVLDRLRDDNPERFEAVNQEVGHWLPEFDRILFETPREGQRSIMLRTREGHTIPAADLSHGTLFALAIMTLAYLPDPPAIVCFEEPDRGLHPRLLRDVRDALYRLAYPDGCGEKRKAVQVIATTHSPYMLDLFRDHPDEIVIANKVADNVDFQRLSDRADLAEILGDSHLGDIWYSGILGGSPSRAMKVAVLSESSADEAAIWILVEAAATCNVELASLCRLRSRGWPSVCSILPTVIKDLHYQTDAQGLVVVVDSNSSPPHLDSHDEEPDHACRLCQLRAQVGRTMATLRTVPGKARLKTAIGMASPAIEAWYLCGRQLGVSEKAWEDGMASHTWPYTRNRLKELAYGTERPSLELSTRVAKQDAARLAKDLSILENAFPHGFGGLVRELRAWR